MFVRSAAALALCAAPAFSQSHDLTNPNHWYDAGCCSGQDCQPVRASAVRETADGFLVTLAADDHKMLSRDAEYLVPYDSARVRPGKDQDYHACIGFASKALLCLYEPIRGF